MPPVSDPDRPEDFKYSGWLSFYLFKTDVKLESGENNSQTKGKNTIQQKLPDYKQGNPASPGDGFRVANTPTLFKQMDLINEYPFLNDLIHIQHIQEEYQNQMVYDEEKNDFVEANTVEISTSDVFWTYPQYLCIRASRQESDRVRSRMRSILVDSLRTKRVEFDQDFIIWLIYKNHKNQRIDDEISLKRVQSIEISGESDILGAENQLSDLQDPSVIALLPILEGKTPESIEAMFEYCGRNVVSNINNDRIQILSSRESPKELSDLEQMALALSFVSKFTALYDQWTNLPNDERYPPVSFFKQIYKQAVQEGYETKGISQNLIKKYEHFQENG